MGRLAGKALGSRLQMLPRRLITQGGRPPSHTAAGKASHPFASRQGSKVRRHVLLRDRWRCQICAVTLRPSRTHPAGAIVDHIEPVALSPSLAMEESNCWAVCRSCHAGACAEIEAKHAGDAVAISMAKRGHALLEAERRGDVAAGGGSISTAAQMETSGSPQSENFSGAI